MKAIYITLGVCVAILAIVIVFKKRKRNKNKISETAAEIIESQEIDDSEDEKSDEEKTKLSEKFGMAVSDTVSKIDNPSKKIANKGVCKRACEARYPFSARKRNNCKNNCK